METDRHLAIISRLMVKLLMELSGRPERERDGEKVAALLVLIRARDARSTDPGASVSISEVRDRLANMAGAADVLEWCDRALAEGAD